MLKKPIDVYLASPYSDPNDHVKFLRWCNVCYAASRLIAQGLTVISPIAHSHPIAVYGIDGGFDTWRKLDFGLLECCRCMVVLAIPGWEESKGILAEMRKCEEDGIPYQIWRETPWDGAIYRPRNLIAPSDVAMWVRSCP